MKEKIKEAEKAIRLYAIMQTEGNVASLKRKGKIKPKSEVNDAYYEGLVKGLMMRIPDELTEFLHP